MVLTIQQMGQKSPKLFANDKDGQICAMTTYNVRAEMTCRVTDWGQGCQSSQHLWFWTTGMCHDILPCYVLITGQGFPNMWVTWFIVTSSSRGPSLKRQGLLCIALMLHSGRKHLNFYGFPAVTNFSSNCQDLLHAEQSKQLSFSSYQRE